MDYKRIQDEFNHKFPGGEFIIGGPAPTCDGNAHTVWLQIEPLESANATREFAYARLVEMVSFLRPLRSMFGNGDHIWFIIGFPEYVKRKKRRIIKGWIPASRLDEVQSSRFEDVGGWMAEQEDWSAELWD